MINISTSESSNIQYMVLRSISRAGVVVDNLFSWAFLSITDILHCNVECYGRLGTE